MGVQQISNIKMVRATTFAVLASLIDFFCPGLRVLPNLVRMVFHFMIIVVCHLVPASGMSVSVDTFDETVDIDDVFVLIEV